MEFLSYLISGISLGSVYAIIALGYTMVYGIAKMLNFAHGDIIMVGGYISFCAMSYLELPSILAVLLAMVVCTVLGVVIEGLAYKPLRSAPSLAAVSYTHLDVYKRQVQFLGNGDEHQHEPGNKAVFGQGDDNGGHPLPEAGAGDVRRLLQLRADGKHIGCILYTSRCV